MSTTALPVPTIVPLTQNTPEWLAYRQSMRNASESAALLQCSPWVTPYQLWLDKTGRRQVRVTQAMQRGTDLEPLARQAYEEQTGLVMQPLVLQAGRYSASLDGMTLDGDLVLEIKCPLRGSRSDLWQDVLGGAVPEHYRVQLQHQLMVSGAAQAHLWIFDGSHGILHEIGRDEGLMQRIQEGWDAFQPHLDHDTPPPLTDADTRQRHDEAWHDAARAYLHARQQAEAAAAAADAARAALVQLADHPREQGAGVTVTRFWKQGAVDYRKVPQLQGVDLEAYRKEATQEVRVTVAT